MNPPKGKGRGRGRARRSQEHAHRSSTEVKPKRSGAAAVSPEVNSMGSYNFKVGEAVWAKMKGYPLWPGKIISIENDPKKKNQKKYKIFFFGSNNFAYIRDPNVIPHTEEVISTLNRKRAVLHQVAIDELIKYYIECNEADENESSDHESKTSTSDSDEEEEPLPHESRTNASDSDSDEKEDLLPHESETNTSDSDSDEKEDPLPYESKTDTSDSDSDEKEPLPMSEVFSESEDGTNSSDSLEENEPSTSEYKKSVTDKIVTKRSPSPSLQSPVVPIKHRKLILLPIRPLNQIQCKRESTNTVEEYKNLKLGFIGMGTFGIFFIKQLLRNGNCVSVLHKELSDFLCNDLLLMGVNLVKYPENLIMECDITFCNVKDSVTVKEILFSNHGVIKGLQKINESRDRSFEFGHNAYKRGYVEMSPIDPETSITNAEALILYGAHYLEASSISKENEKENFVILSAGNSSLFEIVTPFLKLLTSKVLFVSLGTGNACRMKIIFNSLSGTVCAAVAECMVLIDRLKLPKDEFLNLIRNGPLNSEPIVELAQKMIEENFKKDISLRSMQKDLFNAVKIGDEFQQSTSIIATANELYRRAKHTEDTADMSAVYKLLKYY